MSIPILKYLDVFIGLAFVMIVTGTAVAAITQIVLSLLRTRARHLQNGLAELVRLASGNLTAGEAWQLVETVLTSSQAGAKFLGSRWLQALFLGLRADVVRREELLTRLLEIIAAAPKPVEGQPLTPAQKLAEIMQGGLDAGQILAGIRAGMVGQEQSAPDRGAAAWRKDAVLAEVGRLLGEAEKLGNEAAAASGRLTATAVSKAAADSVAEALTNAALAYRQGAQFVARLVSDFDTTVERVTDTFATEVRIITGAVALVLCLLYQIDTLDLVKRLSLDDVMRKALVEKATAMANRPTPSAVPVAPAAQTAPVPTTAPAATKAPAAAKLATPPPAAPAGSPKPSYSDLKQQLDAAVRTPSPEGIDSTLAVSIRNSSFDDLKDRLEDAVQRYEYNRLHDQLNELAPLNLAPRWPSAWPEARNTLALHGWGIFVSWILVSLGTPFWFDLIKQALNLRSLAAGTEAKERQDRAEDQTASAAKPGGAKS